MFLVGDPKQYFNWKSDIIINTVNCVGVMGAGLALEFKNRFPENFQCYHQMCKDKLIRIGELFIFIENGKTIVNFPTKNHWRNPSEFDYIEKGLVALREFLLKVDNKIVFVPALGCRNGGLSWKPVFTTVMEILSDIDKTIVLFGPLNEGCLAVADYLKLKMYEVDHAL